MVSMRHEKRQRERKRKRKTIISIIFILFLSSIMFFVFQYWDAKQQAQKDAEQFRDSEQSEEYEKNFKGDEGLENEDQINVLLLGEDIDSNGTSRTDTIMVGQYDPKHNRAKLVSIMRDTYVTIPGHYNNKINAAFAFGGPELLRQTIKENFGIDIHYYAIINFRGFERVVDTIAPNGVEVDVEKRMYYQATDVQIDLYPGVQKLNGAELLDYARFRNDIESDFGRVERQQKVMSLLKDEMFSFTSLLKLPKAIGTIEPYIDTNMENEKIYKIAYDFMKDKPSQIETMRIPMDGTYTNETYEHAGAVLDINFQTNTEAFNEFFEGQSLEDYKEATNEDTNQNQ